MVVIRATPISIPGDKAEGEYLLGAARNATAGAYQVVLTAVSGATRASYYDTSNRTYVASKAFNLTVAEPHIEGRLVRTSIERGKTAELEAQEPLEQCEQAESAQHGRRWLRRCRRRSRRNRAHPY